MITNDAGAAPRTGAYYAWLNGYGTTHTDSVSQSVAIPAATSATLAFYLRIASDETTTSTAYDTLKVQVISGGTTSTLATYSNLNKGTSYVARSLNLSAYAGKTVTVKFLGVEDSSAATSFLVDDTSLTTADASRAAVRRRRPVVCRRLFTRWVSGRARRACGRRWRPGCGRARRARRSAIGRGGEREQERGTVPGGHCGQLLPGERRWRRGLPDALNVTPTVNGNPGEWSLQRGDLGLLPGQVPAGVTQG